MRDDINRPAGDQPPSEPPLPPASVAALLDARRQMTICNACRYCEGYCDVFPAITRSAPFADGDIVQLANLCHNCRGCYYACQYTEPHEFALNLPAALAKVRTESWERYIWPRRFTTLFQERGGAIALATVAGFAAFIALIQALPEGDGAGFYAFVPHNVMVAIFLPAFFLPLLVVAAGLRSYWRTTGGRAIRLAHLGEAVAAAARLRNLSGGQGQGCNFEKEDRYSDTRRWMHQAVLYGFLLCFASTSSATVLHYGFGIEAPYGLFSLPKLFGIPGGVLMTVGAAGLIWLKGQADRSLGAARMWSGEMGFAHLVLLVAVSGLVLYAATGTVLVAPLLAFHLGAVLAFFLLMPYSKMVHGFFRMAALIRDAQDRVR